MFYYMYCNQHLFIFVYRNFVYQDSNNDRTILYLHQEKNNMFLWSEEILEGEICRIFSEHYEDSVLPRSNMYK